MSLHHGLSGLRNIHFTDICILPWFLTSYQASLNGLNLLRNSSFDPDFGFAKDAELAYSV